MNLFLHQQDAEKSKKPWNLLAISTLLSFALLFSGQAFANLLTQTTNLSGSNWTKSSGGISTSGKRITFPANNSGYCLHQVINGDFREGETLIFTANNIWQGSDTYGVSVGSGLVLRLKTYNDSRVADNTITLTKNESRVRASICRFGSNKVSGSLAFEGLNLRLIPVSNTFRVSTVYQFNQAMNNVRAGGIIRLVSGTYNSLTINNKNFSSDVTIEPAPDASNINIKKLTVTNSSRIVFQDLVFKPRFYKSKGQNADGYTTVHLQGSNLKFQRNQINFSTADTTRWSKDTWKKQAGHAIRGIGSGLIIQDNDIENIDFGMRVTPKNSHIRRNRINNFRGDGITVSGNQTTAGNTVIAQNVIMNSFNVDVGEPDENHNDGIQFYTKTGQVVGTSVLSGFTVRRNKIIQTTDRNRDHLEYMQGIGAFSGAKVDYLTIEDNIVVTSANHGIMNEYSGSHVYIRNNTVLYNGTGENKPWVGLRLNSGLPAGPQIKNNIITRLLPNFWGGNDRRVTISGNRVLDKSQYTTHFTSPFGEAIAIKSSSGLKSIGARSYQFY